MVLKDLPYFFSKLSNMYIYRSPSYYYFISQTLSKISSRLNTFPGLMLTSKIIQTLF
jgi:hypothetical protein